MAIFGLTAARVRSALRGGSLAPVASTQSGGWYSLIREPFSGAWQENKEIAIDTVLCNPTVFACVTLIAADVSKMPPRLMLQDGAIWQETTNTEWSPLLRKPNRYQNRMQFLETWILSKTTRGNTYALKERDQKGTVRALYVLNPSRVVPLIAPDGSIYYQLRGDDLAALNFSGGAAFLDANPGAADNTLTVPASEIIHDRYNCLFHPLVGLSPLYAAALAAWQAQTIANASSGFFANGARPSGVLTAPGAIGDATATRLKDYWEGNFTGKNVGRVAVLGDGLKYEAMSVTAVDAQLVEQSKFSAEQICTAFHMPAFKVGVGSMPTYQNGEILNQVYYTDCLQSYVEAIELCLDEGIGLTSGYGVELDLHVLLRMDTGARYKAHSDAISGGWLAPNEARQMEDLPPVDGGETPYMQQQNYALAALARRDDPNTPAPAPAPAPADDVATADPTAAGFALAPMGRAMGEAWILARIADACAVACERWHAQNPPPRAAEPLPGPPGERGERGERGETGAGGRDGRDAPIVIGPPGERGERGERGADGEPGERGERGERGADALALTTMHAAFDPDTRALLLTFGDGVDTVTHRIHLPVPLYRGVYAPPGHYMAGDAVTFDGALYIACADTHEKPQQGETNSGWRLAVKRGARGREGATGRPGADGRDYRKPKP